MGHSNLLSGIIATALSMPWLDPPLREVTRPPDDSCYLRKGSPIAQLSKDPQLTNWGVASLATTHTGMATLVTPRSEGAPPSGSTNENEDDFEASVTHSNKGVAELNTIKEATRKPLWAVVLEQLGPHHSRTVCGELGNDNLFVWLAGVESSVISESSPHPTDQAYFGKLCFCPAPGPNPGSSYGDCLTAGS